MPFSSVRVPHLHDLLRRENRLEPHQTSRGAGDVRGRPFRVREETGRRERWWSTCPEQLLVHQALQVRGDKQLHTC